MVGFWVLEVTSLLWVVTTLNYFISGQMFPLDLLPGFWQTLLKSLPFQYLAYFPAVVFLGKVRGWRLVEGLLVEAAWALALVLLARGLYHRGLRRYKAPTADRKRRHQAMASPGRYVRLFAAFARFGLASEMTFRVNFLVKLSVELLWLSLLVMFYELIFTRTDTVAEWDRNRYLFFVGCHYALGGMIETFFLENCVDFAELVRSGDLDMYLLKPIDEQFLITCRQHGLEHLPEHPARRRRDDLRAGGDALDVRPGPVCVLPGAVRLRLLHGVLLPADVVVAVGVDGAQPEPDGDVVAVHDADALSARDLQHDGLGDAGGMVLHLRRAGDAGGERAGPDTMVRTLDVRFIGWMAFSAGALLLLSRWFFRWALQSYRSASS